MVDVKALLILTTSMLLTVMVAAAGLGAVTSTAALQPRVVVAGAHALIIVPLESPTGARITKIIVNGRVLSVGEVRVPPGTSYLLIESLDSVKVFRSMDTLNTYINANKIFIPGRPIPVVSEYHVRIVFGDGRVLTLTLKP